MKKLTFPLLSLLVSLTACAQSSHLDRFYRKFHTDSETSGSINPSFLLNVQFSSNGNDKTPGGNWMNKITSVRFLTIDAATTPSARQEWAELDRSLKDDQFEEWFNARSGPSRMQLLSRDGKDDLEEVVCLIVDKKSSGLFFYLKGHFTAADRARMQTAFQEKQDPE